MSTASFLKWMAQGLSEVLLTPIQEDQRRQGVGGFVRLFMDKLKDIPKQRHSQIADTLDIWLHQKRIDGYTIPRDDETMDWMEEIIGTLQGILQDES